MLRVEREELTTKSPFLANLYETSSTKGEVVVPLNNFENPSDVVAFLTFCVLAEKPKFEIMRTKWIEYSIYFQFDEMLQVCKEICVI